MYHPSRSVRYAESTCLHGRTVCLAVTGSSAVYRSIDLARLLMRRGARVKTVMSKDAARMVSPELFEWATGEEVFTEFRGETGHVALAEECDALVIAPATAATMAKVAYGIADTPVALVALAFTGKSKPVVVAPAMHRSLYAAPQTRKAVKLLEEHGTMIVPPRVTGLTAKMASIHEIAWKVEAAVLRGEDMRGLRVLVTAGPTREYLDEVRFISSPSSGKMGVALAMEAWARGAEVLLVHGPMTVEPPRLVKSVQVVSAEEMYAAVEEAMKKFKPHVVLLAAAPADFKPARRAEGKIPSKQGKLVLELQATPKVSEAAARNRGEGTVVIGFTAEPASSDEELLRKAKVKLQDHGFDAIVANNVREPGAGFQVDTNAVLILDSEDRWFKTPVLPKREVARIILDKALELLKK